ncbi:MAG: tetratricopeptide repeat protein, partial [Crocinitomicaceae bacterium]
KEYLFQKRTPLNDRTETRLVIGLLLLYAVVNVIFGIYDKAPWDDDCVVRYYNALNAFNEPGKFISLWNRPLFMVLFAPVVQLGKWSIYVWMIILTVVGAYFLYKGMKKMGRGNAFMIVPFLLFQTYFFSISRNAESEPLAVLMICLGVYFLANKKWFWFALIGGLLPLARLELAALLIFWAYILFKEKQYKYILVLGVPMVLWNIAGGIIEGDFAYVFNKTFGKNESPNRYGHGTFGHYFQRYIYVVGPGLYTFFIIGIVAKIKRWNLDAFFFWQMVTGFFLYVLFSWKLDMGNAAGFLRNLLPLAPFTAVLALEGFNFIFEIFSEFAQRKQKNVQFELPQKPFKELTEEELNELNRKKKKTYLKQVEKYEERLKLAKDEFANNQKVLVRKNWRNAVLVFISIGLIGVSIYQFHSFEILSHHLLTEKAEYTNLIWFGATVGVILLGFIVFKFFRFKRVNVLGVSLGLIISFLMLSFSAITEPPNKNMSPEREIMQEVSEFFQPSYLNDNKVYVNHSWFFWANDLDKFDTTKYDEVTMENLEAAKLGEVCIYETHYSHRLAGDVQMKWIENRPDWVELDRRISSKRNFQCLIFQKTDTTSEARLALISKYLEEHPNRSMGYFNRATMYKEQNLLDLALKDYDRSIELEPKWSHVVLNRGLAYIGKKEYEKARIDFRRGLELDTTSSDALLNIGASFALENNLDSALVYYDKALELNPKFVKAWENKGAIYLKQEKPDKAIAAYSGLLKVNPKHENAYLNRAQLYYQQKKFEECKNDLAIALRIRPSNHQARFVRGICFEMLRDKNNACADYTLAAQNGHAQAEQYRQRLCGASM